MGLRMPLLPPGGLGTPGTSSLNKVRLPGPVGLRSHLGDPFPALAWGDPEVAPPTSAETKTGIKALSRGCFKIHTRWDLEGPEGFVARNPCCHLSLGPSLRVSSPGAAAY